MSVIVLGLSHNITWLRKYLLIIELLVEIIVNSVSSFSVFL